MPAIHEVYQVCPEDEIVIVFHDGSIYLYPSFRVPIETVLTAFTIGRQYNQPGFRRPKYPRPTGPYERLEAVPDGALLVYEEPPYRPTEAFPTCDILPEVMHLDDDWNTFSDGAFGCHLSDFTQDDPDNYSAGGCQGSAFLTNFGTFWRFNWESGQGTVRFQSQGASPVGTYDITTPGPNLYVGPPLPATAEMIAGAS